MGQIICKKCGIPKNSIPKIALIRNNCREHQYMINNICLDCGKTKHICGYNCRHIWKRKAFC